MKFLLVLGDFCISAMIANEQRSEVTTAGLVICLCRRRPRRSSRNHCADRYRSS